MTDADYDGHTIDYDGQLRVITRYKGVPKADWSSPPMTAFFDAVESHVSSGKRSCLACHHYRSGDRRTARCDLRDIYREFISDTRAGFERRAVDRARRCCEFEGEA